MGRAELVRLDRMRGMAQQNTRGTTLQADVGRAHKECDRPRAQVLGDAPEQLGKAPAMDRARTARNTPGVVEQGLQEPAVRSGKLEAGELWRKHRELASRTGCTIIAPRKGLYRRRRPGQADLTDGDAIRQKIGDRTGKISRFIEYADR